MAAPAFPPAVATLFLPAYLAGYLAGYLGSYLPGYLYTENKLLPAYTPGASAATH